MFSVRYTLGGEVFDVADGKNHGRFYRCMHGSLTSHVWCQFYSWLYLQNSADGLPLLAVCSCFFQSALHKPQPAK